MKSESPSPVAVSREAKLYICPGETAPISRSVHLARLASFYPKCRDCALRTETGQLPTQMVERLQQTERRVERKSLFTAEGVRGVYLNELTRLRAAEIAAALAGLLWESAPLSAGGDPTLLRPMRPAVVVGHDERPSSPDIVTGVAASLRRMGCQVIDVGLVTRPCFWFSVEHLEASAGVYVTGSGCAVSWTGLDFFDRGGDPVSREDKDDCDRPTAAITLNRLESRLRRSFSRPARRAGSQRTFRAAVPYEAGLWKHFHALRPLTVCCATPSRLVRRTMETLFAGLPCELIPVDVPQRMRDVGDPDDEDVGRLAAAVRDAEAHLGVLVDDDGCRCGFCGERGELVPPPHLVRLVLPLLLAEHPDGKLILGPDMPPSDRVWLETAGVHTVEGGATLAAMARAMRTHNGVLGWGDSERYWFRESPVTCDAVLMLARVLQALSQSDAPFSHLVGAEPASVAAS